MITQEAIGCIVLGADYLFTGPYPAGCRGHRYRVLGFPMGVPEYQQKVYVRALTGPDRGKSFVCSEANFATHYQPVQTPTEQAAETNGNGYAMEPVPEKVAGIALKGSGV